LDRHEACHGGIGRVVVGLLADHLVVGEGEVHLHISRLYQNEALILIGVSEDVLDDIVYHFKVVEVHEFEGRVIADVSGAREVGVDGLEGVDGKGEVAPFSIKLA